MHQIVLEGGLKSEKKLVKSNVEGRVRFGLKRPLWKALQIVQLKNKRFELEMGRSENKLAQKDVKREQKRRRKKN